MGNKASKQASKHSYVLPALHGALPVQARADVVGGIDGVQDSRGVVFVRRGEYDGLEVLAHLLHELLQIWPHVDRDTSVNCEEKDSIVGGAEESKQSEQARAMRETNTPSTPSRNA